MIEDGDVRDLALAARRTLNPALAFSRQATAKLPTKLLSESRAAALREVENLRSAVVGSGFAELFFEPAKLDRLERWTEFSE